MVSNMCLNSSLKSFHNQTASQEAILTVMYPTSSVLKEIEFCFLLIQDIEEEPKENQHPKVLLRSSTVPV